MSFCPFDDACCILTIMYFDNNIYIILPVLHFLYYVSYDNKIRVKI